MKSDRHALRRTATNRLLMRAALGLILVFMALRPAQATDLPAEMLGPWCGQYGGQFPNDEQASHWWRVYDGTRIKDVEECGNRGGIHVRKDGYDYARFGPQASCEFTAIEFRRHGKSEDRLVSETRPEMMTDAPPSDVFIVRATCKKDPNAGWTMPDEDTWNESFEIQTANDWLRTEEIEEG